MKNEETIYHETISKPPEKRKAYLKAACGGDTELLARIEALLKAREVKDSFLEASVPGPNVNIEGPGTKIGRYELLSLIGEGGMGLVYLAEQKEPVKRRIALKIIKPGMDSKQVIARFEAERQALALLDHPNIAHVFDAGTTGAGRPYFVMEYVKGMSITAYCDEHKLNIEQRLKLFKQVCEGIHHAHQKGIIHRDIKPSNILVSVHGDRAAIQTGLRGNPSRPSKGNHSQGHQALEYSCLRARRQGGTKDYRLRNRQGRCQLTDGQNPIYQPGPVVRHARVYESRTGGFGDTGHRHPLGHIRVRRSPL